jgi:hypothetical protein
MRPDTYALICARADAPLIVQGSVLDKFCNKCGERVMVAPSGQAMLRQHPNAEIVCEVCFRAINFGEQKVEFKLASGIDQIANEIANAVPNTRRQRN